ncbi:hypothetical protein DPMN_001065 [Dreissena polymorpha]|uniref:Uncharacterized protein n=1 Tax=Dreissena polymorpha TaxID=45954 RepID=A0A9D4MJK3_DREPO|nr:hypothetical protein DPMN_001065 [Dreissena polymorpha]
MSKFDPNCDCVSPSCNQESILQSSLSLIPIVAVSVHLAIRRSKLDPNCGCVSPSCNQESILKTGGLSLIQTVAVSVHLAIKRSKFDPNCGCVSQSCNQGSKFDPNCGCSSPSCNQESIFQSGGLNLIQTEASILQSGGLSLIPTVAVSVHLAIRRSDPSFNQEFILQSEGLCLIQTVNVSVYLAIRRSKFDPNCGCVNPSCNQEVKSILQSGGLKWIPTVAVSSILQTGGLSLIPTVAVSVQLATKRSKFEPNCGSVSPSCNQESILQSGIHPAMRRSKFDPNCGCSILQSGGLSLIPTVAVSVHLAIRRSKFDPNRGCVSPSCNQESILQSGVHLLIRRSKFDPNCGCRSKFDPNCGCVSPSCNQSILQSRVVTNQMWMDGRRTKTNPKTSPEQSSIFRNVREINKTNVLTKFQDYKAKNVTSIVFDHKISLWSHKENFPTPLADMFFYRSGPFANSSEIYKNNLFTKFHDDWANNVTSRVHVIQLTGTIFELNSCIKETNVLTKFHENWAKNVTSRVEKCPAHWRPCFFTDLNHLNLVRDINQTNVLTNFHDNWAKIVTSRVFTRKTTLPTGGHFFQLTGTTFELNQHISKANILTNFHENWAKNVTSRVFTCFYYIHIEKNAPPTGGHVFSPIRTIWESSSN